MARPHIQYVEYCVYSLQKGIETKVNQFDI